MEGGVQIGPFGSQLHAEDYVLAGVSVVMPAQIGGGRIDFEACAKVSVSKANELSTHLLQPDDLVFSRRGDIGRLAVVEAGAPPAICGTGCIRVRLRPENSSLVVAAACRTTAARKWLNANAVGMTMLNINQGILRRLPFFLPPEATHGAIDGYLRTSSALANANDQLLAAKCEQKRGLMQQLLTGKLRFPGFTEPWKTVRIDQLGVVKSGGTPSTDTPEYWGGVHSWCTPTDVTALNTRYLKKTTRTISDSGVKFSAAELLPPQSVIVCTRATVGIAAINTIPMATNQGFKSIIPGLDVDTDFLYYAIMFVKRELLRRAAGSTFLEVSLTSFREIPILWPSSLNEQKRVSRFLGALDHEIELLEQQRAAFAAQRRGLM